MDQTTDQEATAAVVDMGITIPLSTPAPTPTEDEATAPVTDWGVADSAPAEAKPKPTRDDVMSLFSQVTKWGEIEANVGAAMIIVGFDDNGGVGVLQMLSPTVPMSDESLLTFVKVSEQALAMCKDTIKKRRPELFPPEGPVIGNLNGFRRMS